MFIPEINPNGKLQIEYSRDWKKLKSKRETEVDSSILDTSGSYFLNYGLNCSTWMHLTTHFDDSNYLHVEYDQNPQKFKLPTPPKPKRKPIQREQPLPRWMQKWLEEFDLTPSADSTKLQEQ